MEPNLEREVLLKFENGIEDIPHFRSTAEEKIFLQLQKYNLIYATPRGVFIISQKGREALRSDVKKFISLERFEERLVKDSLRREIEKKWLYFAVVPLIILLTFFLIFSQLGWFR
ncbi:hypothetical protein [Salinimicrobium gaetbulicola]|uniref:Uncharacterized protein n=1 Tax=Salinimicrobium gaetbulicola TaxID=999702 RepID=A0ABW3IH78_9FLAO